MARLTQFEVLRRYQAGERDFRGADLRSLRFRGQTLAGADFSGADLRGTDFLDADLRLARFIGARCGAIWQQRLAQDTIRLIIGVCAGALLIFPVSFLVLFPDTAPAPGTGDSDISTTGLIVFASMAGLTGLAWNGFNRRGVYFIALIAAIAFAACVALPGKDAGDLGSNAARTFTDVVTDSSESIFLPLLEHIYLAVLVITKALFAAVLTVIIAVAVAGAGAIASVVPASIAYGSAVIAAIAFASASHVSDVHSSAVIGAVVFIAWQRSRMGAMGYAAARDLGFGLGSLGGTRFSGADLRGSVFSEADLAGVRFAASRQRATRLEHVCWKGVRGVQLAHNRGTILAEPRTRALLVSGDAPGANLRGLNLSGAFLPQADLRGADLRGAILNEAVLTEAHLEGANMKASQCLGTDLSAAHLTGATLEGWCIDPATQLAGVDCAYVYLLEAMDEQGRRRDDHHRARVPNDSDKRLGPGDFENHFKSRS